MVTVNDCRIIQLPRITDPRGNLTFIEGARHIPFPVRRAYWVYDAPGGERRGGHAHKELQEFFMALSGSFDIVLDDSQEKKTITLNRAYYGLIVPQMIWRHLESFSTNGACLVLASLPFSEDDYIRDYDLYMKMKNE